MPECITPEGLLWLGETKGFWLQTGAFLLSAVAAIVLIFHSGRQARRRATIDLTLHENQNLALHEAKEAIAKLLHKDSGVNLTSLACCSDLGENPNNVHILLVLNNYEFIAAGIKEGAFDEEIYKRMRRSIVIRDWKAFSGYITELRRSRSQDKLFAEFQWLASRWETSFISAELTLMRRAAKLIGM